MMIPIAPLIALSTSCNWSRHPIDEASLRRAVCILELIHAADYSLAQDELRLFEREQAAHGDLTLVLDQWCQLQNSGVTATHSRDAVEGAPTQRLPDDAADPDGLQELKQTGMTHYSKGNVEDAIACWEKIIAVQPADQEIVKLLRRARAVLANEKKIRTNGPPGKPPAVVFSTRGTEDASESKGAESTSDRASPKGETTTGTRAGDSDQQ